MEFGPVFGASEYWHISRGLRKRSHFGACILVLANHFRAHFDRFDGFIFEAEKPFENVCATGASPVQLREYLFLHLFDCKPQNIVAVVVHESATAQEAVLLDGVAA